MEYTSLVALMAQTLDFAGMFPPASLSFEDSLKELGRCFTRTPHRLLFSKYVLKMEEVAKLKTELLFRHLPVQQLPLTVLARPWEVSADEHCWERSLQFELRELLHLEKKFLGSPFPWTLESYETSIPLNVFELSGKQAGELLARGMDCLQKFPLRSVFVEIPAKKLGEKLENALALLSDFEKVGIKIRTGGSDATAAPTIARLLQWCAEKECTFKATQGLHAAFSDGSHLGFINLFTSLAFSRSLGDLSLQTLSDILLSPASAFRFEREKLWWKDLSITREEIERSRRTHRATFGSCSLEEPAEAMVPLMEEVL